MQTQTLAKLSFKLKGLKDYRHIHVTSCSCSHFYRQIGNLAKFLSGCLEVNLVTLLWLGQPPFSPR